MRRSDVLLDVRGLKIYFGTYLGTAKIIDDVTFQIKKGDTVALAGETGCGKSLTAKAILRTIPSPPGMIAGGEILFDGIDILRVSESELQKIRGNRISMIPQDPMTALNPVFTIGEQMTDLILWQAKSKIAIAWLLQTKFDRKLKKKVWNKAVEMLQTLRIPSSELIIKRYPMELSGGMRQRVLIAMALSGDPTLLLADEPATALDVTIQEKINAQLKERISNQKLSMLYVTHDLGIAKKLCNRINIMYAGRVVESASVNKLFIDPLHPYTIGLLESIPRFSGISSEGMSGMIPNYVNPPKGCRFHPRCPSRMNICGEVAPTLQEIKSDHMVACHLHAKEGGN